LALFVILVTKFAGIDINCHAFYMFIINNLYKQDNLKNNLK